MIRAASPVPLIGFAGAPFTLACYLVEGGPSKDFARTKTLMHAEPAVWADLMDRLAAMTVAYLGAQVAAGAQAVQVFDSWVGALSPADYRRSVAPVMARIFDGLRPAGRADHPLRRRSRPASCASRRRPAATSSASTGGSSWTRAGTSSARTTACRATSTRPCSSAPTRRSRGTRERSSTRPAGRPGHVFNLGHGVLPGTDPDALARLVDLVHAHDPGRVPA